MTDVQNQQRSRWPDRQTYASDRQVDIYINKERQRDRLMDEQIDRQTDRRTDRRMEEKTLRWMD